MSVACAVARLDALTFWHTGNEIGDPGAAALASALVKNASVEVLVLDREFDRWGFGAWGVGVRVSMAHRTKGNRIGDAGATALAEALHKNKTVERMVLGGEVGRREGRRVPDTDLQATRFVTMVRLRWPRRW